MPYAPSGSNRNKPTNQTISVVSNLKVDESNKFLKRRRIQGRGSSLGRNVSYE
jgi:hypothetical protein